MKIFVKLQSKSNSLVQVSRKKELILFSPCRNKKKKYNKNPHQNLPEGSELHTWNLEQRLNLQN